MVIFEKEKYIKMHFNDEYIKEIEKEYSIEILFAALKGTQIWGYSNAVSNYNFYVFFKTARQDLTHFRIKDLENDYSLRLYDLNYVLQESKSYIKNLNRVPSILFRDEALDHQIKKQCFEDRADDKLSYLFEVMYSDYIWDSGYLKKHMVELLNSISITGILDYYYSRAYGSLHNVFMNENIKGTKYLNTFLGIACMKWILKKRTIPVMNIYSMMEWCCPNDLKPYLEEIIEKQKTIGLKTLARYENNPVIKKGERERPKITVKKNDAFNHWIDMELRTLASEIELIEFNEKLGLGNSLLSRYERGSKNI